MKRTLIVIFAALLCVSLAGCKEKEKKITIESEIIGEPGWNMELKETIILGPDGNPIEAYEPISEDAIVKSVDEISNLDSLISVFESCYNGVYTVKYDEKTTLASSDGYFLVTNYNSLADLRTELLKTFENETLIDLMMQKYDVFKEDSGKLYYRPAGAQEITFKTDKATINYSNDETCEISVPMFDKKNTETGVYNIEFAKAENGFVISYLTE
ncbi:MAG: hypothetical protein IKU52_08280 [Clostridia bacterium]|nr:hypothetical protein [Clostridia bacterium]